MGRRGGGREWDFRAEGVSHLNLVGTLGSQSSEGVSKWPEPEADKDTKGTGVGVEG